MGCIPHSLDFVGVVSVSILAHVMTPLGGYHGGGGRKRSCVGLPDTELMAYLPSLLLSGSLIINEKLEEEKILPDSSGFLSTLI